jgi:hypothetical protein
MQKRMPASKGDMYEKRVPDLDACARARRSMMTKGWNMKRM